MDILLLTPDDPFPGASGVALRNLGIIRSLALRGHRVTLLCFSDSDADPAAHPNARYCQAVYSAPIPARGKLKRIANLALSGKADMALRLASRDFQIMLSEILKAGRFDIVQFAGLELGCCLPRIMAGAGSAKVVYDAQNAEAELQRRAATIDRQRPNRWLAAVYSTVQAGRLQRFERRTCRAVDAVIAVSAEDRQLLSRHGGAPIFVLPNGIAAADYARDSGHPRRDNQLLFTGKMDYRPNVDAIEWFCSAVFPAIQRACPGAELAVVGRNPHARLRALSAMEGIHISGWVDSVLPYLQAAAVFVAPLRMGSGTRLKILEAMAAGCAVVATSLGAAGLNDDARAALVIADQAEAFSDAVIALLQDGERRAALGECARRQATKHYDWAALIPSLLQAYEDIGLG